MCAEPAENRRPKSIARRHQQINPYGLRGGVEPDRFVEPEFLIRGITEDIIKRQSVAIIGPPMIGKTSLLNFLVSDQCKLYYQNVSGSQPKLQFGNLNILEYSGKSYDELFAGLASSMSKELSPSNKYDSSKNKTALEWIRNTAGQRRTGDPLWILILDAFEQVVSLHGDNRLFFNELNSLSQRYNLCLVIASNRKLSDLTLSSGISISYLSFFRETFLEVWDEATTKRLMFNPQKEELGIFSDADYNFMVLLTALHPLLLQIGCYHLFDFRHRDRNKSAKDDKDLLFNYMQQADSVYRQYWLSELNDTERTWLQDFRWALKEKNKANLTILQKDTLLCIKLAKMGLVLGRPGSLKLPKGFALYLDLERI